MKALTASIDGLKQTQEWAQQLEQQRNDARRWAKAWKESAQANRWNYTEAMRQYNAQQKRACEAEAQVEALRGVCQQFVKAYDEDDFSVGDNMLEDAAQMTREALALTPPAALDELKTQVAQEILAYLRDLWWPSGDYPGCGELTAAGLWSEVNHARDEEKEKVRAEERGRCAGIAAEVAAEEDLTERIGDLGKEFGRTVVRTAERIASDIREADDD